MTLPVLSILQPLENVLTELLKWLHGSVGISWSWSIVVLTVLVRMLLVPITVRQIHSMQNLQAHAPEMKAIQQKWKHDKQRQNEELMKFYRENKINPAASCLPILLQIPIFISLFYVLKDFEKEIFPSYPGSSLEWLGLVDITEPVKDSWGPLLIVIYVASQLSSSYFMSTTMQGAQRILLMVLPIVFIPFIINFPVGLMIYWLTTNLWTTGQGLVTRRLMPKPAAAREAELQDAGQGRAGAGGERVRREEGGEACPNGLREQDGGRPAPPCEAQARRRRRAAMSDEISVEATGETVGEAKWAAMRELERLAPGLARESVRFQVVTEGERGLLGVGYTPARVIATADAVTVTAPEGEPRPSDESGQADRVRELLERTIASVGVSAAVRIEEREDEIVATLVGDDLGVLIGRHGQTIDALQYLANAIGYRAFGESRVPVVVDAAGYRARRAASLETIARRGAEQAIATGSRVELEPMTAVERKIVHELLKDDPEVETGSEGAEPNRFVVVFPRHLAG